MDLRLLKGEAFKSHYGLCVIMRGCSRKGSHGTYNKMQRLLQTKHQNHIGKDKTHFKRMLNGQQKQALLFVKLHSVTDKAQLPVFMSQS